MKLFFRFKWLLLIVPFFMVIWLWFYAVTPVPLLKGTTVTVLIPPQTSFQGIFNILTDAAVIEDDYRFHILAHILRVNRELKAGEYLFTANHTPLQILNILESGAVLLRPLTIVEGFNIFQIADLLAQDGWVSREYFLELVRDPLFIKDLGIKANTLEGYLFPDTYHFVRGQTPQAIIRTMVNRLNEILAKVSQNDNTYIQAISPPRPHHNTKENVRHFQVNSSPPIFFSKHQLLTMASIVEKETARDEERAIVAMVFLNRLAKGMRLQADPTVIYGIPDFDGNLTRQHLRTPSPYNTYLISGLPIGPIANPGRAAITAVLNPAIGSYLYFVSRNDGTHHFSKNLPEHNRAVNRYQRGGRGAAN